MCFRVTNLCGWGREYMRGFSCVQGVWSELGVQQEQRLGLMDQVACGVLKEAETLLGQVSTYICVYSVATKQELL